MASLSRPFNWTKPTIWPCGRSSFKGSARSTPAVSLMRAVAARRFTGASVI